MRRIPRSATSTTTGRACCILRTTTLPGALVIPEYDLAYQVTRPTWLPETRTYGSDWSSAAALLKDIDAGVGIETPLRAPLRDLFHQHPPHVHGQPHLAIEAYVDAHFGGRVLTVACDDLRFARRLEARCRAG